MPTTVTWGGLTLATGSSTDYRILTLEGWEELPASRVDKRNRVNGHGSHPSGVWSDERTVTVTGFCWTAADRDRLLTAMQRQLRYTDDDETSPLTVTVAGRTLTAGAQVTAARQMLIRKEWGVGRFGWLITWRCPDPLRYGATDSATTALPSPGGGLDYPLTYPLTYGAAGVTGRITLRNPGTAAAAVLLAVRGGLPEGWQVSAGEDRIATPVPMPGGQTWTVDTGTGEVLAEGTASRRGSITVADWFTVPPAADDGTPGSLELQFTSFGGTRDPEALLTASVVAAYW